MRIACAFDHAGFPLKGLVMDTLRELGHETIDLGTDSIEPDDYPDKARDDAEASGRPARTTPTRPTSASSTTTSTSSASARA
jgi:ribose 5-phosphate isomerase B